MYQINGPAERIAVAGRTSSPMLLKGSSNLPEQKRKSPIQDIKDVAKTLSIKAYQSL